MVTCKDSRWDRIVAIKFVAAKDNELQRDVDWAHARLEAYAASRAV